MSSRVKGQLRRLLRRLGPDDEVREFAFAEFGPDGQRLTPWYLPGGRELEGEPGPGFALVRIRHVEGLGSPQAMEAGAWCFEGEGDAPCQVTVEFPGGAECPRDWPAAPGRSQMPAAQAFETQAQMPKNPGTRPDREHGGSMREPPSAPTLADLGIDKKESHANPDVEVMVGSTVTSVGETPAQTAGVHGVTRPERRSGAAGCEEVLRDPRTPEASEAPSGVWRSPDAGDLTTLRGERGPDARPLVTTVGADDQQWPDAGHRGDQGDPRDHLDQTDRRDPFAPPAESEIQRLRRLYPHADAGPGSELALLMGDTFDD